MLVRDICVLDRGAKPRAVAADGSSVPAIALTGSPDLDSFTWRPVMRIPCAR